MKSKKESCTIFFMFEEDEHTYISYIFTYRLLITPEMDEVPPRGGHFYRLSLGND